MSELSAGVRLSMEPRDLQKLLRDVVCSEKASALGQNEQIVVFGEHVADLFVLGIKLGLLKSMLEPLGQSNDLLDQVDSLLLDFFVAVSVLVEAEPEGDERHRHHLRNEALHIRVAEARLHVHADVFAVVPALVLCISKLVNNARQGTILHIHNIDAGDALLD